MTNRRDQTTSKASQPRKNKSKTKKEEEVKGQNMRKTNRVDKAKKTAINSKKRTIYAGMSPTPNKDRRAVLNFEGKRYSLNEMPDELKRLVRGLQTAESQLKHAQDQLRVVAVGRQVLASQLKRKLIDVTPCED